MNVCLTNNRPFTTFFEDLIIKKCDTVILSASAIKEGVFCKVKPKAEIAYYGSGTDWLIPSGVF
jgi:hypothetical protein